MIIKTDMKDKIEEILPRYNIHGTGIMPVTDKGVDAIIDLFEKEKEAIIKESLEIADEITQNTNVKQFELTKLIKAVQKMRKMNHFYD